MFGNQEFMVEKKYKKVIKNGIRTTRINCSSSSSNFLFGRQQVKSWIKTIFETKQEIQKASKEFENSSKTTNAE